MGAQAAGSLRTGSPGTCAVGRWLSPCKSQLSASYFQAVLPPDLWKPVGRSLNSLRGGLHVHGRKKKKNGVQIKRGRKPLPQGLPFPFTLAFPTGRWGRKARWSHSGWEFLLYVGMRFTNIFLQGLSRKSLQAGMTAHCWDGADQSAKTTCASESAQCYCFLVIAIKILLVLL